ncbi:tetratricopeptide repeat protein [Sphingomonas sp.]|uniref:tetratricopeptide repeat protein n=1 Tax=Sphingomonas sp. TaxID=28214 RepID=UPI0031E117D4
MTTIRTFLTCSVGALIVSGGLTGCTVGERRAARLDEGAGRAGEMRATAALADQTRRALAQRDGDVAVSLAERLAKADPHQATYRALLGQSYLQAGRFASARQAFTDALQLDPQDGRSALNLSLAMVAGGDGAGARAMLERYAALIPAADLGLAVALSGAPIDGVRILTAAAREPGATVKTRQNLALSLALAGQWDMARMAASADMAPADVEVRMQEWADFAGTANPAAQVAALLGVRPVADTGQPLTLALNAAPSAAVVQDMVRALPQPAAPAETAPIAVAMVPVEPVAAPARPESPVGPILFAARREVVQPLPVTPERPSLRTASAPVSSVLLARPREARLERMAAAPASGSILLRRAEQRGKTGRTGLTERTGEWNVQLGAFGKEEGAQRAWAALTRRFADLAGYVPQSGTLDRPGGPLYRLSVGGMSRADADSLCGRYRVEGGSCFVRRQADDRMAHWARPGIGIASL